MCQIEGKGKRENESERDNWDNVWKCMFGTTTWLKMRNSLIVFALMVMLWTKSSNKTDRDNQGFRLTWSTTWEILRSKEGILLRCLWFPRQCLVVFVSTVPGHRKKAFQSQDCPFLGSIIHDREQYGSTMIFRAEVKLRVDLYLKMHSCFPVINTPCWTIPNQQPLINNIGSTIADQRMDFQVLCGVRQEKTSFTQS